MNLVLPSRFGAVLFVMLGLGIQPAFHGQTAASQRGVQVDTAPATAPSSVSPIGPYYALVIGNNNYKELNKLQTAVGDAKILAQLLHDRFGFQTKVLFDATRADIMGALDDYQRNLPEKSSLLIYYAGHGQKDVAAHRAYWLPVDAQQHYSTNWINAVEITDKLRAIPARHILVIADSCWSGDLTMRSTGASITSTDRNAVLTRMMAMKSRHIMSSGGDEPVADGGGDGHSVFTGALLQSLNDMDGDSFTAQALLTERVQPRVGGRSQQTPEYAIVRDSDADLGDFVFFRLKSPARPTAQASRLAETLNATALNAAPVQTFNTSALDRALTPLDRTRIPQGPLRELLKDAPADRPNPLGGFSDQQGWLIDMRGEILRKTRTMFVDAPATLSIPGGFPVMNSDLQKKLAANPAFKMLKIQLVDDRQAAEVVVVIEPWKTNLFQNTPQNPTDDNVVFSLDVAGHNFFTTTSRVPNGRSNSEQIDSMVQEIVKFLQEVKAAPNRVE